MQPSIAEIVLSATGAQSIDNSTVIQSLWSGYGQIVRLELSGSAHPSVILKHIKLPDGRQTLMLLALTSEKVALRPKTYMRAYIGWLTFTRAF